MQINARKIFYGEKTNNNMKRFFLIILCVLLATRIDAQVELVFDNSHVVSVSFMDYTKDNHGLSCLLQYIDSSNQLLVNGKKVRKSSDVYTEALEDIQCICDEIGHNRVPMAEDLGITVSFMKKQFNRKRIRLKYNNEFMKPSKADCDSILKIYQSLDKFNEWLMKTYPVFDQGVLVVNTAHNPLGLKIIIQTDKKTYYFDMTDIELFQPYMMRTSDKDCLRFLTNFNVNKHLWDLFKALNIKRNIPLKEEVIDSYILFCAEEYRLL